MLLATAILFIFALTASSVFAGTFTESGGKFTVTWEPAADKSSVTLTIEGTTTGWVCLTVSSTGVGHSAGADSFVGWIPDGGAAGSEVIIDGRGEDGLSSQHVTDAAAAPSFTLISAEQTDTTTKFVYSRPAVASDADDVAIVDDVQTFIWAMGTADGDEVAGTYGYHSGYGSFQANMLTDDPDAVVAAGGPGGGGGDLIPIIGGVGGGVVAFAAIGFVYQRSITGRVPPSAGVSAMASGGGAPGGGWSKAQDPTTGNTYYYNSAGDVSWNKPPGM